MSTTSRLRTLPRTSYGVLDLNAELAHERSTIRAFARNVGHKNVNVAESPLNSALTGETMESHGLPLQPRVIGVGIDVTF